MTCEICHKQKAETVLKRDGEKELYVCKACAEAARRKKRKNKSGDGGGKHATASLTVIGPMGSDGRPPPIVEAFVKATLGLMKDLAASSSGGKQAKEPKRCPKCGRKWADMEKGVRLGCPECYKAFRKSITGKFTAMHYGPKHTGSMPHGITGEATREYLEREIAAAVKREDFKRAAELKRKLDAIDGGGEK